MTVDQLNPAKVERKFLLTPAKILGWVGSMRVSYALIVAVVCWVGLILILYSLKLLGLIG